MVDVEGIVAIVGIFIVLPVVVVGGVLGSKFLKLKTAELEVRREELEVQKKKLEYLTAESHRELAARLEREDSR